MSRVRQAWHQLWFAPHDPLAAGVFRLALGALMVAYFIATYTHWERFFATDGMLSLDLMDPAGRTRDIWTVFHLTDGVLPVIVYAWIGIVASVCFTIGFQTRASTITLFVLFASIVHRNRMIVNGEDLVFRMLLFYGCFAPLGRSLSVDRWRARRRRPHAAPAECRVWPIRLMQINIALIYVISLPNKLVDDTAWHDGSAIYLAMSSLRWSRWSFPEAFYAYGGLLSRLLTYGTLLVEAAFPLLVWFRGPRLYVIAALASLHLGIAIFLQNVTFFTLAMVCSFWLFVPSSTIRHAVARLRGRTDADAPAVTGL